MRVRRTGCSGGLAGPVRGRRPRRGHFVREAACSTGAGVTAPAQFLIVSMSFLGATPSGRRSWMARGGHDVTLGLALSTDRVLACQFSASTPVKSRESRHFLRARPGSCLPADAATTRTRSRARSTYTRVSRSPARTFSLTPSRHRWKGSDPARPLVIGNLSEVTDVARGAAYLALAPAGPSDVRPRALRPTVEPDRSDVANARAAVAANCDCAGAASRGDYVRCAAQQGPPRASAAIQAYLPSRRISVALTVTKGRRRCVTATNYSEQLFTAITEYLTPERPARF